MEESKDDSGELNERDSDEEVAISELREQCEILREDFLIRNTGSDWMKQSPMLKYALMKSGAKDFS